MNGSDIYSNARASGRIFLTGGTGFVGRAVIRELLGRGYGVNALVQGKSVEETGDIKSFKGGMFDESAVKDALAGCAVAIHLVGIIVEQPAKGATFEHTHVDGTRAIVDAVKRAGIKRYLHMSANGTRSGAVSEYHETKWLAEELVRASGLDWTIFRPSVIHGPEGELAQMEAGWAMGKKAPWLFMPYFGGGVIGTGGAGLLQPVYVKDVASAYADAIEKPQTIGKTYAIGGADVVTWPQMHRAFAEAVVGKRRAILPIPAWYASALTHVVPAPLLPFNRAQVTMSQEDNTTDLTPFTTDFGWTPSGFVSTLRIYSDDLRAAVEKRTSRR
jgi:uncharacterized protein YbjT (DUF2867 family)